MSDLSFIDRAQPVLVVGSTSDGVETTPLAVDSQQRALVSVERGFVSNGGGVEGSITVGTTPVELRVGAAPLAGRISATAVHVGTGSAVVYFGFTSSVTTSTGTPMTRNALYEFRVGEGTRVYLVASAAGQNVRITECAR